MEPSAILAADFDRSQLGAKTRVHYLAKQLGLTSRDLVLALDSIGLVKVAQSSLSLEEATRLLDALSAPAADVDAPAEPVEKIRRRVEKNVANEIHQIEEKVDRELEAAVELVVEDDEPLEDVEPEITPAPEVTVKTPIFVAPTVEEDVEETETEAPTERSQRKRRGRRGTGRGRGPETSTEAPEEAATEAGEEKAEASTSIEEPIGIKGSTRLEAQRRRRTEMREESRKKRHVVSQQEFMERRESMERRMVVRERSRHDHQGLVTQVGVIEDDRLVEQFVTSDSQMSMVGNIYLGRVQNVLPSMEAAFIDIGKGRNGVLYAGEVDWKAAGLGGRGRRIEQALKSGDQVLVQVTKDPVGHKGARLTTQISLAGRYLVYVPGGRSAGISRKLPGTERKRLKEILGRVVPAHGGAIIRTAAEGVSEENIAADVNRLHTLWEQIQKRTDKEKNTRGSTPVIMYEEPDMLVKVIRDIFNEDFLSLIVDGDRAWNTVRAYIQSVAPDLVSRVEHFDREAHGGSDAFEAFGLNKQIEEALSRKVNLPSGGSLIIDRTEAMTVIDVNTGRFTGRGGNLEETVTRNNIEAAEEIVRQMRLRDLGGMIVVDFIDMVLPENQELVLRRLNEALENDRTRHQVSEVTSLGLVQMTRKRLGPGLLETFSVECEQCGGRGVVVQEDPVDNVDARVEAKAEERSRRHKDQPRDPAQHPMVVAMQDLVEEHDLDHEFEELARSVILDDDGDVAEDIAAIAAAAVDIANDEDPDEPSGSDYVSDYDQRLAEFEANPRRRRATRGNSRSDHAPQQSQPPVEEVVVEETPVEEVPVVVARSRNRRRAVRRTSVVAAPPVTQTAAPVAPATKEPASEHASRRRRRRVVRVNPAESVTSTATQRPAAERPAENPGGNSGGQQKGRRRRSRR
nr:translation initiation factor IF-2 N-terminal domain-containing protein [Corynebacterium pacaense]